MVRRTFSFPRSFAVVYGVLIVYACLYPFSGWRDSGLFLLDYLFAPWPKYFRWEDLILNVGGYIPFGFLVVLGARADHSAVRTIGQTVLIAALLSFSLETTQNFLPVRVASNIDLLLNVLGALLGAVLAAFSRFQLLGPYGVLREWREQHFVPGRTGDVGLILLGLWLFGQFTPDILLFGSGDLRRWFGISAPFAFKVQRFIWIEAALGATTIIAVGLLMRCMMLSKNIWPIIWVLLLSIVIKILAMTLFFVPGDIWAWLTPGAQKGLFFGSVALLIALMLPRVLQHALAGTALLAATVLINLLPRNPYLHDHYLLVNRDGFFNLHGVTQFIDTLWPFVALAYLLALGLWRGQHLMENNVLS